MPQAVATNQSDTCAEEVVLGVDTHKDTHVAAVVTVLGGVIECKAFPTTAAGYRSLLGWARGLGLVRRAGVECTGSYGAGLTRYLLTEGWRVSDFVTHFGVELANIVGVLGGLSVSFLAVGGKPV
jgi:transposase